MNQSDSDISKTHAWFVEAFPFNRTSKNLHTQMGVHFEEVAEMIKEIKGNDVLTNEMIFKAYVALVNLSSHLKRSNNVIEITNREKFLDSLCDQIVTATGCGFMAYMDIVGAMGEVNRSNFSKFDENGKAVLDENLKVAKSPNYRRAELTRFI